MSNQQLPSLQGMRGIVMPPPVSLLPSTPAWAALFVCVTLVLIWMAARAWQVWRRDAYRRFARREIQEAAARGDVAAVCTVVKRAALAAFPRSRVAGLAGAQWADFLRQTAPRAALSTAEAAALASWRYVTPAKQADLAKLAEAAAERWIARHDRRL